MVAEIQGQIPDRLTLDVSVEDALPKCKGCYQKVKIPIDETNFRQENKSSKADFEHLKLLYSLTFCRKCKMFAHLACLGYIPPEDPNRKPKDEDDGSCFTQVLVPIKNQTITFLVYDHCESCVYEH